MLYTFQLSSAHNVQLNTDQSIQALLEQRCKAIRANRIPSRGSSREIREISETLTSLQILVLRLQSTDASFIFLEFELRRFLGRFRFGHLPLELLKVCR